LDEGTAPLEVEQMPTASLQISDVVGGGNAVSPVVLSSEVAALPGELNVPTVVCAELLESNEGDVNDVKPLQVVSNVDGGSSLRDVGGSFALSSSGLKKDNTRPMSAVPSASLYGEEGRPARASFGLGSNACDEVAGSMFSRGGSVSSRPLSVARLASNPSSEHRIFTGMNSQDAFIAGSDMRPRVLVGKARVRNLTSVTPDRQLDGVLMTRGMGKVVDSFPFLSSVEDGGSGVVRRGRLQPSSRSSVRSSSAFVGVQRREARFASAVLSPTGSPLYPQHAPLRIQRQYETCRGIFPSWNDPAVVIPRRERESLPKPSSSELPLLRKQKEGSLPHQNLILHGNRCLTPRIPVNVALQRPVGAADASASHRRLGEVVARIAISRTPSPQQQAMQYFSPELLACPYHREAPYRMRWRRCDASCARIWPTMNLPPYTSQGVPRRPVPLPTLTSPRFTATTGATETTRFVRDRFANY
ncbi:methyltransferase, partial [Trypanosoma rangeli]